MSGGWEQLEDLGLLVRREAEEATRDALGDGMVRVQDAFVDAALVRTGRFRASFEAYTGAPPGDEGQPEGAPHYPPPGNDQVDQVVKQWAPGEEIGFVDQVPYSEGLADRPDIYGREGWLDLVAAEASGK